ncbi:MAG: right-handed parallel beta-helix repeat-containing protein [Pseudonocardia sp.]|nr:right-handed parallel beta-helix repeat-containing protein [Pseudonocardia sp.]
MAVHVTSTGENRADGEPALAALAATPAFPTSVAAAPPVAVTPTAGPPGATAPMKPVDATAEARTQAHKNTDATPSPAATPGTTTAQPARGTASIALATPTTRLFVSPQGNDGNPGTQAAPLGSLARAAGMARPGTQVVVAPGTYPGTVHTQASGTAGARIAFVSSTRGAAKVVTGDGAGEAWRNSGDYVDIVGFDISGSSTDGLTDQGSFVRLVDNKVHGFRGGNCITTANDNYDLHDIDVIGNLAFGCGGSSLDHGIYVSHARGVVSNNIAFNNAGFGIHCWHACNALTISNNLVFDNPQGGIVIGQGDGPNNGRVAADHFVVSNNMAVGNGRDGIRESGATGPNNRFLNNLLWNNAANDIALNTGSQTGTLIKNPLLGDLRPDGTGDYRPRAGSPALDAGVSDGAPRTDIDGRGRPTAAVDLGPYQR